MRGIVKWFNNEKGYGFITFKDTEDIFFHYSVIAKDGYKFLKAGDEVEFELTKTDKGLQATKVIETGN